jgi:hypothetical protein
VLSLQERTEFEQTTAVGIPPDRAVSADAELEGCVNGSGPVLSRPLTRVREGRCDWCQQSLGTLNEKGRRRRYCSQSCRQRAYQSRKRSRQLGLGDGELIVSSLLLARMNRRLEELDEALSEAERANLQAIDVRVARLCEAASRLRGQVVGPPAR